MDNKEGTKFKPEIPKVVELILNRSPKSRLLISERLTPLDETVVLLVVGSGQINAELHHSLKMAVREFAEENREVLTPKGFARLLNPIIISTESLRNIPTNNPFDDGLMELMKLIKRSVFISPSSAEPPTLLPDKRKKCFDSREARKKGHGQKWSPVPNKKLHLKR